MISRAIGVGQRDVGADVEAEPAVGPLRRRWSAADRPRRAARRCWIAFSTWWKKIGCVSRAFDPHRRMTSVSSTSR